MLSFLVWEPLACLAGESFLDRNAKVHEAVPYGRSVEETPSQVEGAQAGQREQREREPAGARDGAALGPPEHRQGQKPDIGGSGTPP